MNETKQGYQMPVREFSNWEVKGTKNHITLMAGSQARIALQAIRRGMDLEAAITLAYTYPPKA